MSVHLNLHLTTTCNMRCTYCYAPPQTGPAMSPAVGCQALAFGARMNSESCGIVFFGGEPLLEQPLMAQLVAEARAMEARGQGRFHFKVTTNGLLMDSSFVDYAVANDILIALSMDGAVRAHDACRRTADGKGTFEAVRARLRLLLAARPYASILSVVSPCTARYLAESVDFLASEGVRYFVLSLDYGARWSEECLDALGEQLEELAQRYLAWSRAGRKFYLSPFETRLASHVQGPDARIDRCDLGRRQLSVDAQGYLYPCVQFARTGADGPWCIGHVATGLDEAALGRVRGQAAVTPAACGECAIADRCHRTCACLNWQATGRVEQPPALLCWYERHLLPLADRVGSTLYEEANPRFLEKVYDPAYPLLSLIEDWCEAG